MYFPSSYISVIHPPTYTYHVLNLSFSFGKTGSKQATQKEQILQQFRDCQGVSRLNHTKDNHGNLDVKQKAAVLLTTYFREG